MRIAACLALAARLAAPDAAGTWIAGADISDLDRIERAGATFRDGAEARDPLAILRDRGVGAVRIRLWHTPAGGACDLASAVGLARRAKALGFRVLLDLHASDHWADPAHQDPPAAWRGLPARALADSLRRHARESVAALVAAGAAPDWIQIGNEVSHGFLWPEGRIAEPGDDEGGRRFARLLAAGVRGAREGARGARPPRVIVHFADGGDATGARAFFARLDRERVRYDAIGLSYYPWWHGPPERLSATIETLGREFGRDVWVVETAYPWTLGWQDDTHNVVGEPEQALAAFPPTPAGQAAFLGDLGARCARLPRARGLFYWGALEVAAPGRGSAFENCALFDSAGRPLPAVAALGSGGHTP